MRNFATIISLITLCSCTHIEQDKEGVARQVEQDAKVVRGNISQTAMRVANDVRDNVKQTNDQIREWFLTPLPSKEKKPMPARYCYRVLQDILCYREQVAGWEGKLVGYQGKDATPPTPVTPQPLPLVSSETTTSPTVRAASLKPVFVGLPSEVKGTKNIVSETTPPNGTHETIPDSPLSPQL